MHQLRVYGLPRGEDQDCDDAESAIESSRLQLKKRQRPSHAEVREKMTSGIVWTGYLTKDGSIAESWPANSEPLQHPAHHSKHGTHSKSD
jgi:hypothetical protein